MPHFNVVTYPVGEYEDAPSLVDWFDPVVSGMGDEGVYHQGVQAMSLMGEALVTCAQTRKARLAELLVG